jgi:hypothetical protein
LEYGKDEVYLKKESEETSLGDISFLTEKTHSSLE